MRKENIINKLTFLFLLIYLYFLNVERIIILLNEQTTRQLNKHIHFHVEEGFTKIITNFKIEHIGLSIFKN